MMESNPSDKSTSGCQGVRPRRSRGAAPLPSMETIHSLRMMSVISAGSGWLGEIVAKYGARSWQRWALGYDGT